MYRQEWVRRLRKFWRKVVQCRWSLSVCKTSLANPAPQKNLLNITVWGFLTLFKRSKKKMVKLDILLVGGATQDIFLKAKSFIGNSLPMGEKLESKEMIIATG